MSTPIGKSSSALAGIFSLCGCDRLRCTDGRQRRPCQIPARTHDLGRFVRRIATGVALVGVHWTQVATSLARRIRAVHLRIDTIEQALRNEGHTVSGPAGYLATRSLAEDNPRIGHTVIADSAIRQRLLATTGTQPRRV